MKLSTIKLTTSIATAFLLSTISTATVASTYQANDLVKVEAFNTTEFSSLMNLTVTQSVKTIKIQHNFAKNTADKILVTQSSKLDKVQTKTTEQVSIIAE